MSTPTAKSWLKFVVTPSLSEPVDVDRFTDDRTAPPVQRMRTWGGEVDTYRHTGVCIHCGTATYQSDLGANDPRGPMGNHANQALNPHDDTGDEYVGPPINLCGYCGSEEYAYKRAIDLAIRLGIWRRP